MKEQTVQEIVQQAYDIQRKIDLDWAYLIYIAMVGVFMFLKLNGYHLISEKTYNNLLNKKERK